MNYNNPGNKAVWYIITWKCKLIMKTKVINSELGDTSSTIMSTCLLKTILYLNKNIAPMN